MMRVRNKPMTVYLSGPMRGIEDFNRPAFAAAAARLRESGYIVIVPGENEEYDEFELASRTTARQKTEFYLSRDIDWIQEAADVVVVLPGWENSEGSKLEVLVAQSIGVPVWSFTTGRPVSGRVVTHVQEDRADIDAWESEGGSHVRV
jgi:hypothetical protein